MASGIFSTLSCPHCNRTIEALIAGQAIRCPHCAGVVEQPVFPVLDNAANQIGALRVVPYSAYMRVSLDERRSFFSVPGVESIDGLLKIKSILAECFDKGEDLRDFERKLKKVFGKSLKISPEAVEKVFRGNVNRAYIDGLLKTIEQPIVSSCFPYLEFSACADDRTPATHLALEHFGLNGTSVYRSDDPFWRRFMPPLTDLCRCTVIQTTIRGAAEEGVKEAQEWLSTGQPPQRPEWVKLPAYDPRQDLEDEWWPDPEHLETPQAILKGVLAARRHLVTEMRKPSSHPRAGPSRRGLSMPTTPEQGLALLQGRIDAEFILPPLKYYFEAMKGIDMENVPPWKGEPENEWESLATLDAIIACCRQAGRQG
jgi:hypothetical protein